MNLTVALTLLAVLLLLVAARFFAARNYLGHNDPFYAGNFATSDPGPVQELTVVSYNISYGRKIDQALAEIRELCPQTMPDILLLQEMEESGTERLAGGLQMNYVYFPAAVEVKYHRNFGNAVLSRWPIVDAQKLILPHISLSDRMRRIATRATIRIHNASIVAYSIHTEPVFILPRFKEDQCFAVLQDAGVQARLVVVGGDFNAFTDAYVDKLEKRYSQAGFVRASKGSGYTFSRFGVRLPPDQIFTKGFVVKAAGSLPGAKASDHLPVWVTLIPGPGVKTNDVESGPYGKGTLGNGLGQPDQLPF